RGGAEASPGEADALRGTGARAALDRRLVLAAPAAAARTVRRPVTRGPRAMRRLRAAVALAALSIAFAVAPLGATSAWGQGTIWAECISGSVAQTCQVSSWYTSPLVVVWHAAPFPEATSPCL